eukprot:2684308-Rhodomonas_salina.2
MLQAGASAAHGGGGGAGVGQQPFWTAGQRPIHGPCQLPKSYLHPTYTLPTPYLHPTLVRYRTKQHLLLGTGRFTYRLSFPNPYQNPTETLL